MRSFRKIICRVIVLLVFGVVVSIGGRYIYESPRIPIVYVRKELKETKGTVDTLLLGTSLVHWGLDPSVISEELDAVCFNLATDIQPLSSSYYLLKDQIKNNPIKRVFIGTGVAGMQSDTNTAVGRRLTILDRILSPSVKLEYMFKEGEFKDFEQFLIYPTRVENVLDLEEIKRNVSYKQTEEFQNNISPSYAYWQYFGMGFQGHERVYDGKFSAEKLSEGSIWNRENIFEGSVNAIRNMAELCKENDVELNIVIFPHVYEYAKMQGDLSDMDAWFTEFCEELGIGLYDYNYTAYEGIYEILPDEYYYDKKHLNAKGAAAIAHLLCSDYKERTES